MVYDVPLLNTHGEELWQEIQNRTAGNVTTFIISHGHPDHWGSLDFFQRQLPGATILGAKETAFYMDCTGEPNLRLSREWQPHLQGIPERLVMPTELFQGEKLIDAGDFTLRLHTTGPGEDTEHTVLYIPELKTILPNDLVYNGWHPWNELERDGHWLRIIDWLRTFDAQTIVPGHGPVCGPEIYDVMETWLRTFQDLRLKYAGRYSVKDMPAVNRLQMMAELKALFPDWYDEEIPFSCGQVVSVPYSYGENKFSAEKF
ncbi:MAG: MBL fold metallo-hydrolase [Thermoleophilia bacterium]|nr:MBL fold metallo-hydrolase [Thermoleophilia bacterium]